mmetsp:Transcript_9532/g.21881  ORF Transcript_9532/g.21881 Transcript_9532/m.21881 type:complete len:217 (-) Transcript_9532:611-1261(-)
MAPGLCGAGMVLAQDRHLCAPAACVVLLAMTESRKSTCSRIESTSLLFFASSPPRREATRCRNSSHSTRPILSPSSALLAFFCRSSSTPWRKCDISYLTPVTFLCAAAMSCESWSTPSCNISVSALSALYSVSLCTTRPSRSTSSLICPTLRSISPRKAVRSRFALSISLLASISCRSCRSNLVVVWSSRRSCSRLSRETCPSNSLSRSSRASSLS